MALLTRAERMLIGGDLVESDSGLFDDVLDPATEEIIGRVPAGTARDVDRAVAAAEKAWPLWAATPPLERAEALRRFAGLLDARRDELLVTEVRDTGNTIRSMRFDVRWSIDSLNYYAGLIPELKGETIPATLENLHFTIREPYGVVARIVPFNHPLMFAVARTAGALAAGNAVIVKPPETSPLSAMVLAEIAREAFPPGVFNIVTGTGRDVGDALVRHPRIKRIAFIGSSSTGQAIQRAAAEAGVKHVSLELGGKNPMIVLPDNDPDEIADAAMRGMNFGGQGQSCGSTSRLLLHESLYEQVVARLAERVASLRVGDPMDEATEMGPINSEAHLARINGFIAAGRNEGARLIVGGDRPKGERFGRGYWLSATLFAETSPRMRIWQEEIFGPVLAVAKWGSMDEVVEQANSTQYGLAAAIWTKNIKDALRLAREVRSGYVWINGSGPHFTGLAFGGMGNSGVGREECLEEMFSYTETKAVSVFL